MMQPNIRRLAKVMLGFAAACLIAVDTVSACGWFGARTRQQSCTPAPTCWTPAPVCHPPAAICYSPAPVRRHAPHVEPVRPQRLEPLPPEPPVDEPPPTLEAPEPPTPFKPAPVAPPEPPVEEPDDTPFQELAPELPDVDADDPFQPGVEEQTTIPLPMRLWRDNTGYYRVQARLAEISDNQVRLLKDNGRFTTVPMRRLSSADRRYVEQLVAQYGRGEIRRVASRD